MEKRIAACVCVVVLSCLLLSGCQNQGTVVSDLSSKITLDSHGLVKFVNSSMDRIKDQKSGAESVKVSWMFQNNVSRTISIRIDVQFFDVANKLLYNQTKRLENMVRGTRSSISRRRTGSCSQALMLPRSTMSSFQRRRSPDFFPVHECR